jgi:hypothetical protein
VGYEEQKKQPKEAIQTNPYETKKHTTLYEKPVHVPLNQRVLVFALVTLIGVCNSGIALIDAYRERYPTVDGYLFIGIATLIPYGVGAIGMLTQFFHRSAKYWFWAVGSIVAQLPGLLIWSMCAAMPTPRMHLGAGQMHIFFLPIVHIGYSMFVYFGIGLLILAISRDGK